MAAMVAPLGSLVRFPPSRSACTVLRRTPILEQQQAWDVGSVCEGTLQQVQFSYNQFS